MALPQRRNFFGMLTFEEVKPLRAGEMALFDHQLKLMKARTVDSLGIKIEINDEALERGLSLF